MKKYIAGGIYVVLSLFLCFATVHVALADTVIDTVPVGVGPFNAVSIGTKIYVTNYASSTVSIIDTANNNSVTTIPVGNAPEGITSLGTKVYVANFFDDTITIIDTANNNAKSTINVASGPSYFATVGTKVYVSSANARKVTVIDTANNNATSTIGVDIAPFKMLALGTKIYLIAGNSPSIIDVIDTANNNATSSIAVNSGYSLVSVGTKVYMTDFAHSVNVIDTANGNATSTIAFPTFANIYKMTVIGTKIYVDDYQGQYVGVIDTANNNATSTISTGKNGYGITSLGNKVYVANNYNSGTVTVIDTANNNSITTLAVGQTPTDFITLGNNVYILNNGSASISVIASQYNLSYVAGQNGMIQGATTQGVVAGNDASSVTAVPNSGYQFSGWSDGVTTNPRTDKAVSHDITVTANFSVIPSHGGGGSGYVSLDELKKIFGIQVIASSTPISVTQPIVGTSTTSLLLTQNLSVGMNNPEVKVLQHYLNTHGFTVAVSGVGSLNNETTRFGLATKAALIKFQKSVGIKPALGYVGLTTRAYINSH